MPFQLFGGHQGITLMRILKSILFRQGYIYMLAGGLVFLAVLGVAYSRIESINYEYRDDGVITMSHAKNLIDHGHIGVNPSGERVEGFSAPVQFWTYSLVYALFGTHFTDFADMQTLVCTFLMGFFFVGIFHKKWLAGLLVSVPAAWFMSLHISFLEWHASGMENAVTHALLFGVLFLLTKFLYEGRIAMGWAVFIALASLSRLESIYHIMPVMLVFVAFMKHEQGSWKGFRFVGLVLALWSLYHVWRLWYFGTLEPNTGAAQGISVGENLASSFKRAEGHVSYSISLGQEILQTHGGWWLLVLVPLFPFINWNPRRRWIFFAGMALVLTSFLNPFLFGPTRLDTTRSTTFLTPVLALVLAHILPGFALLKRRSLAIPLAAIMAFLLYVMTPSLLVKPHYICCSILRYEEVAEAARDFGNENDLHRVNLATPDLGKISYLKEFNITDIGLLGSPLMAKMYRDKDMLEAYFLGFAQPDFIQIHEGFAKDYGRLLIGEKFTEVYAPLETKRTEWLRVHAPDLGSLEEGYYVRRDLLKSSGSREWRLIQDMKAGIDPKRIEAELSLAVDADDPAAHQYVVRSAFRFLPEIKQAGLYREVLDLFASTPSAPYDQAVLSSGRNRSWIKDAGDYLDAYLGPLTRGRTERLVGKSPKKIYDEGRRRVYIDEDRKMTFAFLRPANQDSFPKFHLHVHKPDSEGVTLKPILLDFYMDTSAAVLDREELFYSVQLPKDVPLDHMIFGQHWPGVLIWEGTYRWK